ncbi:MAG: GntR family transcriptional regulator [Verrucomicrobiae bacterium]|nr:GntR family transcriptional regulator [Verrucomicrobiae bacterium]
MKPLFPLDINIDRKALSPAWEQIAGRIRTMIREGDLRPGDRLPTDRELAGKLDMARGTIRRAYEQLQREQLIEMTQGRGSFVRHPVSSRHPGKDEQADVLVEDMISKLEMLRFSHEEIRQLLESKLHEREQVMKRLEIAVVDCNPESLAAYGRQLNLPSCIRLKHHLLEDLKGASKPCAALGDVDLVITTATHHHDLQRIIPELADRLCQVALAPTPRTIVELASLSAGQNAGVFCQSRRFQEIVCRALAELQVAGAPHPALLFAEEKNLADFLRNRKSLIVPPGFDPDFSPKRAGIIRDFTEKGGRLICFDYQVEKGSLLHIQERINSLLNAKISNEN